MTAKRLIPTPPPNLRERSRANGSTRIWWEPSAAARKLGFDAVELDAKRLTWSVREAEKLNRELAAAQKAGRRAAPASSGRSVEALVEAYRRSRKWDGLKPATRRDYDAAFRLIIRKWGPYQIRDFDKPTVYAWYETLTEHSGAWQAKSLLRKFSILFSHAEILGWRAENSNPCTKLALQSPKGRARTASWPEIDALLAAADRLGLLSIRVAITLALFQGQRQTDVFSATRAAFAQMHFPGPQGDAAPGWVWAFQRSKRGNEAVMRLHDEAAAAVEAAMANPAPDHDRLIWDERTGRAYDTTNFQTRWQDVRAAAIDADTVNALPDLATLQFRDLRRTFGVLARRAGVSRDDVGDALGNSIARNPQLAGIYTPAEIETRSRAIRAIERPQPQPKRKEA